MSALAAVFAQYPLEVEHAEGVWLHARGGRRVLDLYGGHAVAALGYGHPGWTRAVQAQAATCNFQSNAVPMAVRERAAARLLRFAGGGYDSVFFVNSGAEANENALKMAFRMTSRPQVAAVEGSFHGRTAAAGTITWGAREKWHAFPRTPFDVSWMPRRGIGAIARHVTQDTAAVIVEPVQGVGGAFDMGAEFLRALRRRCDEVGALLIFDEVITGYGRTGQAFAAQSFGVTPDMITMAKAITNGAQPMGVVAVSERIHDTVMAAAPEGAVEFFHGYTYSGHPAACAAGLAPLAIYKRDGLFERGRALSPYFLDGLFSLKDLPVVTDIRGYGMLGAIDVASDGVPGRRGNLFQKKLFDNGLHLKTTGDVAIVAPPLIAEKSHVDTIVDILRRTLAAL